MGNEVTLLAQEGLETVLGEIAGAFTRTHRAPARVVSTPPQDMRHRLDIYPAPDLIAVAGLARARAATRPGSTAPAVVFARGLPCLYLRPGLLDRPRPALDLLLDPGLRLGLAVAADGAALAGGVLDRAELLAPGARAATEARALPLPHLAGTGRGLGRGLRTGRFDLALGLRCGAAVTLAACPGARVLDLPADLAATTDFALALLSGRPEAAWLSFFILSPEGQGLLRRHGFGSVAETAESYDCARREGVMELPPCPVSALPPPTAPRKRRA
ncbi:substrate-binding domain-containing protein [Roseomonas sp. KE0001]|uniref:substrate-binding domain-containing protein n=1 Tax=Roseomonas sp. KE0001 TaxID=2479201 RepID=UPI0018DF08E7|nr:substrate-binding domain-containing protein [Roseomonas sp. KE0001]MBI0434669.1 hypothetical protein [Roseomonas sp. KE0001]